MQPLRCGSLALPGVDPYLPASGEMFGAHLAELRLLKAVLRSDLNLQWDFWNTNTLPSLAHTTRQLPTPPHLADFKDFGDRVRLRSIEALAEIALQPSYLFVSSLPFMSRIAELRTHFGAHRMPLCALTHSLYTKDPFLTYSSLLVSAQPCDRIVVASGAGKQALDQLLAVTAQRIAQQLDLPEAKLSRPTIAKIPFGVDLPPSNELTREPARALLQVPSEAFVVLYFGRISEEYKADLDPLLQVVYHARSIGHPIWLMLAGQSMDPVYSQHLQRRLCALRIAEQSIVLENCPDFLKTALYRACDVMISPAESVQETFGLSILEAMAHARPVIASDWSGYRDLVEDGKTGFLIPTTWVPEAAERAALIAMLAPPLLAAHSLSQRTLLDTEALLAKLLLLVENPSLRQILGDAGRARVEAHYTWPCVAKQFLALWSEQLSAPGPISQPSPPHVFEAFRHYATTDLRPGDLLVPPGTDDDSDLLASWNFHKNEAREEVRRLLRRTAHTLLSVGEALHEGFELDTILWTVKKGLRNLADPASLDAAHDS
jgi:glycosyltransferase involved in cell wall biosynthesis